MNVLVLGGNGYLGSKVVRKLLTDDHKVISPEGQVLTYKGWQI